MTIAINGGGYDTLLMLPSLSAVGAQARRIGGRYTLDYSAYSSDIYVNSPLARPRTSGDGNAYYHIVIGSADSEILVGSDRVNTLTGNAGRLRLLVELVTI